MSRALKAKPPRPPAPTVAQLQDEIRSYGMRSTGPRVAVLAYLSKATAPLSHTELHEALADRGYDRATIYRNLMDLAEAGLLVRSDLGDHVWRFERRQVARGTRKGTHTSSAPTAARSPAFRTWPSRSSVARALRRRSARGTSRSRSKAAATPARRARRLASLRSQRGGFRGLGRPYASRRVTSVRREMPSSLAACV